ncbi:MAG: amino acid adenylation domain-containing protein, partial [Bacteroidota bacterium]
TVDHLVGICLERGLEMVVGILGILKAGGAYVPIDPEYPQKRIAYMLADSAVKLVLSKASSRTVLDSLKDFSVLALDSDWNSIEPYSTAHLDRSISTSDLAYVMYTSGSTGKPKGVMMPHKAMFNLISFDYQLGIACQRVGQFTSMSFDVSFLEIFFTITQGGELHIVPSALKSDLAGFTAFINDNAIETVFLPTAFFHFIGAENVLEKLPSLEHIIVAGEQLQLSKTVKKGLEQIGVTLHNHYGPTEAHVVTTTKVDYRSKNSGDQLAVIGKPIANTQIYMLNHSLHLVPTGIVGELCIGGASVARGYLNKEKLTSEKFIANPFKHGDRLYKTGDLARWLPDGTIELIGRKDDQVKIRGYRIELGEIENALSSLPGIGQCCVLAREDSNGNKRLIAYVVIAGDLDKEALQTALQENLPEYMVPTLWVELDEMPLTNNGKIDKKSLPKPDESGLSSKEYVAPRTATEAQVAAIWQDVLGVEKVGIYDNFFELGGHSLLATRLVAMIRKELDKEIAIRDVFNHTTVERLTAYLAQQEGGTLLPKVTNVKERPDNIPLSFSQERLWFLDQLQGSLEYHLPFAIRLSGALDKKALVLSLREVVNRHEVLRTVIYSESGIGYQKVLSADHWELSSRDLTKDPSLLTEQLRSFLATPFDLSSDYMFRSCLFELGAGEYVLAGAFHHISSDGWSQNILLREFMALYRSYATGKEANLHPLPLQYVDYALWQRNHLEGKIIEDELSYWEDTLGGVETLDLPTDYIRPAFQSISGATLSFELSNTLIAGIRSLSQREGVTVFMTLLAAFKVLMSRYSGQEDICVGTPVANRTQKELEGIIGFFVNTLALRTKVTQASSFTAVLQAIKQTTLDAYDHQQVPFEKVVERVVKTRDMSINPLFQVLFALQNIPDPEAIKLDGLTVSDYEDKEEVAAKFDLTIIVNETDLGISVNVNYCTDLFKAATIQRMFAHYQELLSAIVTFPSEEVGKLSMLTAKETHQLLEVFNDTAVTYPKDKTIVDLFEEQARKTPNAIAVVYEGSVLRYKELDERSNQLARYLTDTGVAIEDLVGVCLQRGPEMIISILGIMKSGGVYVPIDPMYPADRIRYVIEDASIRVMLSSTNLVEGISDLGVDKLILLDAVSASIQRQSIAPLAVGLSVDNLAYVIYTSGSTGKPKGVLIEHKGICNTILGQISVFSVSDKDHCLQYASPAFDASIWEILLSLLSGAKLCIIEESRKYEIDYFVRFVKEQKITFSILPPAFFKLLDVSQILSIKTLITGGEEAPLKNARLFSRTGNYFNAYGPTETSICATTFNGEIDTSVPIGSPVPNTTVYLLNEASALVPIGAVGELCIGGAGMGRGYLNRESLTKQRFVTNPFKAGERMYKTGDLARWLPDGTIEYIGRKDHQVKIRGYRIELGEIENTLSALTEVNQCCVLAKADNLGDKRLIAYVVLEGESDKDSLQKLLAKDLPEYMVPNLWVQLDEMPLTTSGKIDRNALPDLDDSALSTKEYVAPRTKIEAQIAMIWQELLNVEKVGIYDNFFELGGHSVLAIRLVAIIRKELDIEIAIRDVFVHSTIDSLGVYLLEQDKGSKVPKVVAVEEKPARVPLSFSQES